ncbi:MAG: PKD domain-containing protein [Candidatus Delongbacteria bacterium]|nr:PKD domain-containing protein [Candidatus Delongbacteria bacterium]MBN2834510.1 PKD domain-containing protein [Candidatus Delongbacteria bacterium]
MKIKQYVLILILMFNLYSVPSISGPEYYLVNEGQTVSIDFDVEEPSGSNVIFFLGGNISSGMFINSFSGIFYWQTDFDDSGSYSVEIIASSIINSVVYSDTLNLAIDVVDVDRPIVFNTEPAQGALLNCYEGEVLNFSVDAYDPDGNDIWYEWKVNGQHISSSSSMVIQTGYLETDPFHSGNYSVSLTMGELNSDNSIYITWQLAILDVNRDPIITTISPEPGSVNIDENEGIVFYCDAYDPDLETITYLYELDGAIVSQNSVYNFLTNYNSEGSYNLKLFIGDGVNIVENEWLIEVSDVDAPIEIIEILPISGGNLTIIENESINFSVNAFDPDGLLLSYEWLLNNVTASNESSFVFTTNYQSAGLYYVKLIIDGGFTEPTILNWEVSVLEYDRPIIVDSIQPAPGSMTINELENIMFSIEAHDPDGNELSFQYMLDNSIVSSLSTYQYVADYYSQGQRVVKATINDYSKNSLDIIWNITVNDVDAPPYLYNINQITANEGENIGFYLECDEPDNDPIIFYPVSGFVPGMNINSNTGYFSWTPSFNSAGEYNIKVAASSEGFSGIVLSDSVSVKINVLNSQPGLIITEISPSQGGLEIDENESINFHVQAINPDFPPPVYEYKLNGVVVSNSSDFEFITNYNFAGQFNLNCKVSGESGSGMIYRYVNWSILVHDVDRQIEVISQTPPSAETLVLQEGTEEYFIVEAIDPDGKEVFYKWIFDDQLVSEETEYQLGLDYESSGNHTMKLELYDGDADPELSVLWNIVVENVNRPIIIDNYSPSSLDLSIDEMESIPFSLTAHDPDGNPISYQWFVNDNIAGINQNFTFNTSYTQGQNVYSAGDYVVKVMLSDESKEQSTKKSNIRKSENTKSVLTWNVHVNNIPSPILVNYLSPLPGVINLDEGQTQNFIFSGINPEGYTLTYDWKLNYQTVSTDSIFQYVTTYNSAGTHYLTLKVSDQTGNELNYEYLVIVHNTTSSIVINEIIPETGDLIINENESISFSASAFSTLGNNLSYQWKVNNSIVSQTNSYQFDTNYSSAGNYLLVLKIYDSIGNDSRSFGWNIDVIDIDQEIVINELLPSNTNISIDETELVEFSIDAFDPDGNDLVYRWKLNGDIVSEENNYTFITDYNSSGNYQVLLEVFDNFGLTEKTSKSVFVNNWDIEVINNNRPVVITSLSFTSGGAHIPIDQTIMESQSLHFSVEAYDPDLDPFYTKWYIDNQLVSEVSTFNFVSSYQGSNNTWHDGVYTLKLDISELERDNKVFSRKNNREEFIWTITVLDNNDPLVVSELYPPNGSVINIMETDSTIFYINALDPDGWDLNYRWTVQDTLVSSTSGFTLTTDYFSSSNKNVKLEVTDVDHSGNASNIILEYHWTVVVSNVNQPIVINLLEPALVDTISIIESENILFKISAYDPDLNGIDYLWKLHDLVTVSEDSIYNFTTDYNSAGYYKLVLHARESSYIDSIMTWNIKVNEADFIMETLEPTPGDIIINENDMLDFNALATVPGGGDVSYYWYNNEVSVSSTNSYQLVTDYNSAGSINMKLIVITPSNECEYFWNIQVLNVDRPPVFDPVPEQQGYEKENISLQIHAYDPDGTNVSYSISENITGVNLNPDSGQFSWTPDSTQAGNYNIHFIASSSPNKMEKKSYIKQRFTLEPKETKSDTILVKFFIGEDLGQIKVKRLMPSYGGYFMMNENDTLDFNLELEHNLSENPVLTWKINNISVSNEDEYRFETDYFSAGNYQLGLNIYSLLGNVDKDYNWNIQVNDVNRPPYFVNFQPMETDLSVSIGEDVEFFADAFDPDSTDVDIVWLIDNEIVGHGVNFTTQFTDSAKIVSIASDGELTDSLYWNVKTSVDIDDNVIYETKLFGNYPNPFNPETIIKFSLDNTYAVRFRVFNINGQEVYLTPVKLFQKGINELIFNGENFSSGVYFYRIEMKDKVLEKRMLLLK